MPSELSVESVKLSIGYYYLLSFCPPGRAADFQAAAAPLRKGLAKKEGLGEEDFFALAVPEVCRRVLSFHQDTRQPQQAEVRALSALAEKAHQGAEGLVAFQGEMKRIAGLDGRAKQENRLHRKKGCRFCQAPCAYGYFSLISDPSYPILLDMLQRENHKPAGERNPVQVLWSFTVEHLFRTLGVRQAYITAEHLGNLAYCLLLLGMAKSRFALPEKQVTASQAANQEWIRRWQARAAAGGD